MSRRSAIPGHEPMPPMQAAAVWRMRRDGPDWSSRDEAAFQAWLAEAIKEPWIVESDEIDYIQARAKANGPA